MEEITVDHHYPNAIAYTEAAQEQSDAVRLQRIKTQPVPAENPAPTQRDGQFIRDRVIVARPAPAENRENRGIKM